MHCTAHSALDCPDVGMNALYMPSKVSGGCWMLMAVLAERLLKYRMLDGCCKLHAQPSGSVCRWYILYVLLARYGMRL